MMRCAAKREEKFAIFSALALHPDPFSVRLYDGLGDEQTETDARFVQSATLITLIKTLKHVRQILLWNPLPLVINRDPDALFGIADPYPKRSAVP